MTQAGPAIPVLVSTAAPDAGPALRVAFVSDGRPIEAGPARRVVVVSDGRPTQANEPVPLVYASSAQAGRLLAGPAIPIVIIGNTSLYTEQVKALGPIAYWPLAEASGTTATDESGNGRTGTYTNVTLGATGIGDGRTAATFAAGSVCNVFSASLQSAFNGAEGTFAIWIQVSAAGVWTDATTRDLTHITNGALTNGIRILRTATNNTVRVSYVAGGTSKSVDIGSLSSTGWIHLALTWSKSADQMRAYLNGAQSGATQTGLGTNNAQIASTTTVLGAANTSAANPWSGNLAHAAVWTAALSAAQIASLATI